jgi:hypothetical protein
MPRIGVTGHLDLTPATVELVTGAIRQLLTVYPAEQLTGVSCLAAGADRLFAEAVLATGGRLEAVLPAADYRDRKVGFEQLAAFDRLVMEAVQVRVMPHAQSGPAAYESANEAMLDSSDLLIAVWDGRAGQGRDGTAAVVAEALSRGMPVTVVWPDGAARA